MSTTYEQYLETWRQPLYRRLAVALNDVRIAKRPAFERILLDEATIMDLNHEAIVALRASNPELYRRSILGLVGQ